MTAKPREDGNLVLSGRWPMGGLSWPVKHADGGSVRMSFHGRAPVRPGHYPDLKVMEKQCKPLPLDVPKGDVITFGFVTYPDREEGSLACYDLTITLQRVMF